MKSLKLQCIRENPIWHAHLFTHQRYRPDWDSGCNKPAPNNGQASTEGVAKDAANTHTVHVFSRRWKKNNKSLIRQEFYYLMSLSGLLS